MAVCHSGIVANLSLSQALELESTHRVQTSTNAVYYYPNTYPPKMSEASTDNFSKLLDRAFLTFYGQSTSGIRFQDHVFLILNFWALA